jgi:hypothetical protein
MRVPYSVEASAISCSLLNHQNRFSSGFTVHNIPLSVMIASSSLIMLRFT